MGNYFSFLHKQGIHNIKRSVLILLGISLSIAVMSGVNVYINSAQMSYLNVKLDNMSDLYIGYYHQSFGYYGQIYDNKMEPMEEIIEKSDIDVDTYILNFFQLRQLALFKNYSNVPEDDKIGLQDIEFLNVDMFILENSFFESKRFNEFISIKQGTYPTNPNEMLIDYASYQRLNLTIGTPIDIDLKFYRNRWAYNGTETSGTLSHPLFDYNWTDVVISGVYLPTKPLFYFQNEQYYSEDNYKYAQTSISNLPLLESELMPIFTTYNYVDNNYYIDEDHFFIENFNQITEDFVRNEYDYTNYMHAYYGVLCEYDRSQITATKLISTKNKINNAYTFIDGQIEYYGLDVTTNIYSTVFTSQNLFARLNEVQTRFEAIKIEFQLINIPVFIFAIIIGNLGFKTKIKGRNEEFLLFRSKGMSNWKINQIIVVEALYSSTFIFILGMTGGLAFYSLFRHFLTDYLSLSQNLLTLMTPSWVSFLTTFLFSVGITFLSSISIFTYVNRMSSDKILKALGSDDMDVLYDEKTLFDEKTVQEEEDFQDMLKRMEPEKADQMKKYYENQIKMSEHKISSSAILLIILGILPFFPFVLVALSNVIENDLLLQFSTTLRLYGPIFEAILIFSPILLVLGIIKGIILDKPSRFAKVGKYLSTPFLKAKNFICGMELVRRSQFRYLLLILALFSGILMYTNIYTTTSLNESIIKDNLDVGADILGEPVGFGNRLRNMRDINTYKEDMINSFENNSQLQIEDMVFVYHQYNYFDDIDQSINLFIVDFERYYEVVTESNKFQVSQDFRSTMASIIEKNRNLEEESVPSVIANTLLFNEMQITPKIEHETTFMHEIYYYENDTETPEYVPGILDYQLDILPGIAPESVMKLEYVVLLDYYSVMHTNWSLISDDFTVLFDVNFLQNEIDYDLFEDDIANASIGKLVFGDFYYYDFRWDDLKFRMVPYGIEKFFGIVHFEAILIGILMSFGLAIILLAYQEDNKYFNGILLSRGFGKIGILRLIFSEMTVLFLIAILGGGLLSAIMAFITIALKPLLYPKFVNLSYFVFFDPLTLFGLYGLICLLSYALYFISYQINARKSITRYFHKF